MLEALQHDHNSFWTLTYAPEMVPVTVDKKLPNLVPSDLTYFMKRLRKEFYPQKLRYFNVGEYGDKSERPHYHLALFGFPGCSRGNTNVNRRGHCCSVCDSVREIWDKGLVYAGELTASSAAYIAGYVTKKLTSKEDERLKGRNQEFARMSLKPGIGATAIPEVASVCLSLSAMVKGPDVPMSLRHGARVLPLGRYLTRMLRVQTGMEANAPLETIQAQAEKLRPLREIAFRTAQAGTYKAIFRSEILAANEGPYQQMVARAKIFKKRGCL